MSMLTQSSCKVLPPDIPTCRLHLMIRLRARSMLNEQHHYHAQLWTRRTGGGLRSSLWPCCCPQVCPTRERSVVTQLPFSLV